MEQLRTSTLAIDSNVVVSKVERPIVPTTRSPRTLHTSTTTETSNYFYRRGSACAAEYENDSRYKEICSNKSALPHRLKRQAPGDPNVVISMNQVYKATKVDNSSVFQLFLGFWDVANGMSNAEEIVDVIERKLSNGYKLSIGMRNSSQDGASISLGNTFQMEDELDEESHLLELLDCLLYGQNAR